MHVALRLSASELVFGSEEMPVILDDTFAFYDDGRLKAFLRWLSEKRGRTGHSHDLPAPGV